MSAYGRETGQANTGKACRRHFILPPLFSLLSVACDGINTTTIIFHFPLPLASLLLLLSRPSSSRLIVFSTLIAFQSQHFPSNSSITQNTRFLDFQTEILVLLL